MSTHDRDVPGQGSFPFRRVGAAGHRRSADSRSRSTREPGRLHELLRRRYPIGICVNDRNTGTNAYPDYYVNGAVPANCRIKVEVWDNANHRYGPVFKDGSPCTRGHHPANGTWCVSNWDPADYGSHVTVHAYFRLYSGSGQINDTSTNSPSITVSFTGMAHC